MAIKQAITHKAKSLGFSAIGFTSATLPPAIGQRLEVFLADGRQGEMTWLKERSEQRRSPDALWPEARSVISLGFNYTIPSHSRESGKPPPSSEQNAGLIASYAHGRDYHDVVKKQLRVLARWIAETYKADVKIFVDTAPVMEKPLAQQAGLGWQGKHTNLVSREFGSWLFLCEIFTTLELEPDREEVDHCGACTRCLDICPTRAITAPYQLDARRCISYLTIEHKGPIPRELRPLMGSHIYGCDDCLAVCPWNKFAKAGDAALLQINPQNHLPNLAELVTLDNAAFRTRFAGSPVKRTGRDRFVRNVLIAIGNSGNKALVPAILDRLTDASPLVRAAAIWALSQLDAPSIALHKKFDDDPDVQAEWAYADHALPD